MGENFLWTSSLNHLKNSIQQKSRRYIMSNFILKNYGKFPAIFLLLFFIFNGCTEQKNPSEEIMPPKAEKIKKELTIHGDTRVDNYFWLNDRENPKVIKYLEDENEYLNKVMKHTEKLQDKLFDEIVGRIKKTDESVPYKDNKYYYYRRYEEGKEYAIFCRKKENLEAEEKIMLNVNEIAEGHDFCSVVGLSVSEDNRFLSFGVDTVSRRKYTIHFKDLYTGKILDDEILNTTGGATWAKNNKTVFYVLKDKTLRAYKIKKHVLGTNATNDKKVYQENDVTFSTYVNKSKSKKYIFIGSYSTLSTEIRFLDANNPDGKFKIIQPREKDHEYSVSHFEDKFYVITNWKAKNFRLMETNVNKTTKENWKEVIANRDDVFLQSIEIFKNYLVVSERAKGLRQIRIINQKTKNEHYLDFGEAAYMAYVSTNREFDTDLLRYGYTSMTTPNSTFDYNIKTKEKKLLKQQEVVGDFDSQDYHSERLYAKARDGVEIPISIVYRKGFSRNGTHPLLLYGYGSYGYSMEATFSSVRLSLLDRGFAYAIAHVRGGQEMGRWWYEDGKLLKKKNTFTDFIDCAEFLIKENFTGTDGLFAMGGSAGGLLMGAIYNMRPALFKGIVAAVPWVDVVTTMLDDSIPLTTSEYDEWGNPKEKKYYDYMLSYSPYDNVEAKNYPAMLVTTGLHDSQVQYFEPAKWVAKLRELKTDNNLLLLHTNMQAGHGGKSGRFKRYRETALEYAFMLDQLGIKK